MGHEAKKFLVLEQNSFWLFEWPQRREKKRFSVTEVTYQYNNKYLIDVKLAISLKHHASSFFFAVGLAPLAPLPPDGNYNILKTIIKMKKKYLNTHSMLGFWYFTY